MELIAPTPPAKCSDSRWPNMFIFPKELRDAIPDYGARALVFDAVSGTPTRGPAFLAGSPAAEALADGPRAQVRFLVHETGAYDGKFPLLLDHRRRDLARAGTVLYRPCRSGAKVEELTPRNSTPQGLRSAAGSISKIREAVK